MVVALRAIAAAETTTTTAARAIFTRTSLVDGEGATVTHLAVEGFDGGLAFCCGTHRDEAKATGAIGHTIHDEHRFLHFAVRCEEVFELVFGSIEGKISDV